MLDFMTQNALCVAGDERAEVYARAGVTDADLARADAAYAAAVQDILVPAPAAPVVSSEGEAALARLFHDTYEAAAVSAGWETQQRSRTTWEGLPEANRETMLATCRAVIAAGYVSPADHAAALATARAEGRADGLREGADELWRVFLRLPHTPSPVSDFVQRRVLHLRELAAAALSEEPT